MIKEKRAFKAGMVATMEHLADLVGTPCSPWKDEDQLLLDIWFAKYKKYNK